MPARIRATPYDRSVFINCPFDEEYRPILNAVVFAIHDFGFDARCVLAIRNSSEYRLDKIIGLIRECKYGIHDLSRTELDPESALPRFNMPFELGLFVGARNFGAGIQRSKNFMVFDRQKYRYQKFISDIAGQDIFNHHNDPLTAIKQVQSWLHTCTDIQKKPSAKKIIGRYEQFRRELPQMCEVGHLDLDGLGFVEYSFLVSTWLETYFKK